MNYEDDVSPVEPYPPWKAALAAFLTSGFSPGDTVPHGWFWKAFGMEQPRPDTAAEKYERLKLAFLQQFGPLREALLCEHKIDLANVQGEGYRVVPPQEQTKLAYQDGVADLRKALAKMADRLVNVDHLALTNDQRRENAEALARLSMLETMRRRARRLPGPTDPE